MIFNEHPSVWWFYFTFKLRFFFFNGISFLWLRTLSRILLSLQYRNEEINFSDDYFSLKNNTISLLFMWILWNKSACKYLHTLLNDYWECDLFLFMRIWSSNYRNIQYWLSSNHVLIIFASYDIHHDQESQSDGMDHQWFQNTIVIDIIKMTFLCIISPNIYYYHLNPWYILWCRNATPLIMWK